MGKLNSYLLQNKTKVQQVVFKLDNITVHIIPMKPILELELELRETT